MATTEETEITVTSSGDGITSEWTVSTTNSNGAAGGPIKTTLASGDNTIAVPTGAMGMVLSPIASSATVFKLKGGAGETGFCLRGGKPSFISLPTGTVSVLLNASAVDIVQLHWT
jgi:hypothetical protein